MADRLKLTAKPGGAPAQENPAVAEIVLTVTAPAGTDAEGLKLRRDGSPADGGFEAAGTDFTTKVTAVGKYSVRLGDDPATESDPVTITLAEAKPEQQANDAKSVSEIEAGELDGPFLWATFAVTVVGVIVLFHLASHQIRFLNGLTAAWTEESFPERSAGQLQFIALMCGVGLLLVGGWLAALETRGRLRTVNSPKPGEAAGDAADSPGKQASVVLDSLTLARGTIATLFIGAALVLAALWASVNLAAPNTEERTKPSETSTTSTSTTAPPTTT
ncbi:MAG TPA: hypothetical protein VM677_16705 [Actinokineospora sp.]|jgi:hypothetical protein|nr:hypothetical protein [Actinokineospora sp.]